MAETSLTERTLAAIGATDLPLETLELPQSARRRDTVGRLLLCAADAISVVVA
jgi:hypothetical protein